MKHTINRHKDKIEIQITGIGKDGEFFAPSPNLCSAIDHRCGRERYATLDFLCVTPIPDGVKLELKSRDSIALNLDEAEQCLDNAMELILAEREKEKV